MHAAIERLAKGDATVANDFQSMVKFWHDFWPTNRDLSDAALSKAIGGAQWTLEALLKQDRSFVKSTMPTTMIAALYSADEGFGDNESLARRALAALAASDVSIEIKGTALRVAKQLYRLDT